MAKILKKGALDNFIAYLLEQIGEPFLWGGQHTKLTEADYVATIKRKETSAANASACIAFCEEKFAKGASVLYAYDCSGLGVYWLYNLEKVISSDTTANGLLGLCDKADAPKRGFWVFRTDTSGKATHVGYMVSDTEVVHAKGRKFGVVLERYSPSYWKIAAKPRVFDFGASPVTKQAYIRTKGTVRVRTGNGTSFPQIKPTAPKGAELLCFGQAEKDPYWYEVEWQGERGYITANERYTEIVWKTGK